MRGLRIAFILALMLPLTATAQSFGGLSSDMTGNPLTVSVNPQYPAPYGQAVLSFVSSTVDLASATVTVSVGGKRIYQGSARPVAVPLGKAGSTTNVVVSLSVGGTSYDQTLSIQPQDVALVAEPIASVPPLYPGKPLVPIDGSVRVIAIANLKSADGRAVDPATLSYSWTVDGAQIANSSGIGKAAIMVAAPLQYRARDVSVAVTSADGAQVGGGEFTLMPADPSVRIYENDPLLGIRFDHALGDGYAITGTEATLYAAPFSLPISAGAPLIQWFLNGSVVQTGRTVTLRPSGAGEGTASLSVTASAGAYAKAAASVSLSFGTKPSFNLFGL